MKNDERENTEAQSRLPDVGEKAADRQEMPRPQSDRKRNVLINISLLIAGTVTALVLLEIIIRIVPLRAQTAAWNDRPSYSYTPEASPDNRNYPFTREKPPGTFRIIALGDSFTFAGKVHFDDNYALRLERMLNLNSNGPRVEVLNWGVPGFSTAQEARLMKKAVSDYHPDLVLLEITLNDAELQPYRVAQGAVESRRKDVMQSWIVSHSRVLNLLLGRYYNTLQNQEYVDYHIGLFENETSWSQFSASLDSIAQLGERHQIPILAFIFPMFSHTINANYPFAPIHEKIMTRLSQTSIHALDLRPFYLNIPPARLQAIPEEDPHPNEIAHRIAADAIYDRLVNDKLLPEGAVIRNYHKGGRRLSANVLKGNIYDSTNMSGGVTSADHDEDEHDSVRP